MRLVSKIVVFILFLAAVYPSLAAEKIAVFPWKVNGPQELRYLEGAMTDMLSTRVGARFELISGWSVEKALEENPSLDRAGLSKKLGADYALWGSITVVGEELSIDANFFSVKDEKTTPLYLGGRGLASVIKMVDELSERVPYAKAPAGEPAVGERAYKGKFAPPEKEEIKKEPPEKREEFITKREREFLWKETFVEPIKAFETSDLDGDGIKEFFLLSENSLIVAKAGKDGVKKVKTLSSDASTVSISAAGDRVYVSLLGKNEPRSCILEYKNGDYLYTKCGIPYFIRSVGGALLAQDFNRQWGFKKKILTADKDGVESGAMDVPSGVNLYGFELLDLTGDGSPEVVSLDNSGHIRVFAKEGDGWSGIWRSPESYGTTLNTIDIDEKGFVLIKEGFSYGDFDGDGRSEVAVKRNIPGGVFGGLAERVRTFKSGRVAGLLWDGASFEEVWSGKEFSGYVADFAIEDTDGAQELVMLVNESGFLSAGVKTFLISYKLSIER